MNCTLCGTGIHLSLYHLKDLEVMRCSGCGLIYTDLVEKGIGWEEVYSADYFKERKGYYLDNVVMDPIQEIDNESIEDFRRGLEIIESFKKPGKILDLGCAMGVFLCMASDKGWEAYGVDLSEYAVKFAREKFGLKVVSGKLKEARFPDKFFDVVTLWDTIEHLPNPLEELLEIRRVLKDDGIVLFDTPNVESLIRVLAHYLYKITGGMFQYPVRKLYHEYHLYYFCEGTLRRLLKKGGFEVLRLEKKIIPITKARGNGLEKAIVKMLSLAEQMTGREYELFVIVRRAD